MSVFSYKQRNNIVLGIIFILAGIILYALRPIAGSLLSTIVMYTIFRPVYLHLINKWRWRPSLSALSIILSSFAIIVVPFLTLSLMVIDKIAEFQKDPMRIKVLINKLNDYVGNTLHQPDLIEKGTQKLGTFASDLFPSIVGGAAGIVLGLLVMYFLLYFMFTQHESFESSLIKYAPFREQNAVRFADELKNTTYSNVLGQGVIAVIQGALVSIGFYIFGIKDPIFWGVISTFLSFLPLVGAPVVFIPAAVIELVNGHTFQGWGLLLWGLILITNIDNVIRFLLAKRIGNIHPIITVIGVLIGIPLFGILGLVFGPILLSYFILAIRIYETSKLAEERLDRIKLAEEDQISENRKTP